MTCFRAVRVALVAVLALALAKSGTAGPGFPNTTPQEATAARSDSAARDAAPRIEAIDKFLKGLLADDEPGAAVLVMRGGEVVHEAGYGIGDVKKKTPITRLSQFRLASVSKHFTATCILLLAQEGELALDDSLREHFPDFPDYADAIQIRHLLHHTSGLKDYMGLFAASLAPAEPTSLDTVALLAEQDSLRFGPGQKFEYSNSGYVTLAAIAEHVSGQTLADFAREHLFGPLGMEWSVYHDDQRPALPHRVRSYRRRAGGRWQDIDDHRLNVIVGDGAVYTNLVDMARWVRALDAGTLLSEELRTEAVTSGRLVDGTETGYGYGWQLGKFGGRPTIEHGGGWVGFRTYLLRIPSEKLAVVLLANFAGAASNRWAREIARIVLGEAGDGQEGGDDGGR